MTKHQSKRLIRWRWIIEEFVPAFKYIRGSDNTVADAMSRLPTHEAKTVNHKCSAALCNMEADYTSHIFDLRNVETEEIFNLEKVVKTHSEYPLSLKTIRDKQQNDPVLTKALLHHKEFFSKEIEAQNVIICKGKIYIPKNLV